MSKENDVTDLLGEGPKTAPAAKKAVAKPATKTAAKPAAKNGGAAKTEAKPAAKPATKTAAKPAAKAPAKKAAPAAKAAKEPIEFADGEREKLLKKIPVLAKAAISSKELAGKMGIETRKLRPLLYSAERQGLVTLKLAASRTEGMTVKAK